ncbi:glycosyltransferase [Marinobacter salinexigens]|uniref:Glycosyltransferase n=1 Tax=Marinobacter salinexigens TaxID=2919747 RepID=A0A5B0VC51_9GAMM|nr:glycosyltransferase [Marinobacter salinexigens]KAA1171629.1 glycosyltransferase [Marinobacter salinexigens]
MNDRAGLTIAFLLATPGTTWGGMEKHTADLADALAGHGHTIHVLAHKAYRHRFSTSTHFHPVPVQMGRRNPWLSHRLKRVLRPIAADIIHAQGNKAATLLSGLPCGIARVRIGTVHGIKSSHGPFAKLDHVIAVSQQIYDQLDHPSSHLIYNGVARPIPAQTGCSSRLPPGMVAGSLNVVAVGRLEPVKNFSLLIKAWAELASAFSHAHLTIYGEGSERRHLENLVREVNAGDSISLPGFVEPMAPAYQQADLTVISSDREGFPYALVESLLADCPVISTPVSGCREMLPANALSQDHSMDSFKNIIAQALGELEKLKASEKSAMAFAREKLTLEAMAKQTEQLYVDALAGYPPT